ncbi:metallophosphatase family protein [Cellulomonas sp. ACRRI]|uniref:metallophosphoesterase family protein n=1 Tax=Cellulomonas sp. ACRRI TaxID=2918188 RepID=UPI001EF30551|nr:metallophosphoesterase family protein [Cellulomonas sp. ACRRI]MCG7288369.1 metallophosphatase family protein [Cellulomonas sp. ACRRI]
MPAPDADPRTAASPAPDRPGRRRRWLGRALLAVVALLASLVFGVTTATAESSLGPHEARYDVTTDATVTIDLGPFGTLQIDSPLPLGLGARVTVEEIPADVDALHGIDTLQALTGDLNSYLQFFTGPQATIEDAARALVVDALWRTLAALVVLVAAWTAGWWLLGPARREELAGWLAPRTAQLTAGGLAVVLVGTLVTASERGEAAERTASQTASAVFDGTPLEGARITGRLGGIVDTYGGLVVKAFQDNEEFYDRADGALVAAWAGWEERRDAVEADAAGEEDADADAAPAAAGGSPTPTPTPEESTEEEEPLTLLVISDLHCNVGMAPLITSLAEMSGAEVVLDAGDTTMNGTSVEQYCVTTFARAIPSGVDLVTAPGNHDSAETTAQYARAGATVLDGGVIDVRGMRILGDKDPKATRLITTQTQDESYAEVGERLSEVACEDPDGVDLVLFHNPRTAPALLADGCVPALVSGHMHTRTDPEQIGEGIRYTSSSTAGAQENEPRIGPLKGTAEMTLLRWDPTSRRILDWQLVEIGTDAGAVVHDPVRWPAVVPEPEDEVGAPSATPTEAATEPAAP